MKKLSSFILAILCMAIHTQAATLYWVGPLNGKWSDAKNWSLFNVPGSGGAGVPGTADDAVFSFIPGTWGVSMVNFDATAFVKTLRVEKRTYVNLYTSANRTLYVFGTFTLAGTLTDSTSEDVKFNFFMAGGITGSIGSVPDEARANWIFSGRVPVSSGNGAMFTTGTTTVLTVGNGGNIISRNNSGFPVLSAASLKFAPGSRYVLENNLNAAIPTATWGSTNAYENYVPPAEIQINGTAKSISHTDKPGYAAVRVNLYSASTDVDLSLPDGTSISQNLIVESTNGRTLNLLKATGPSSLVSASIGYFTIQGSAKVALAHAPASATSLSYNLFVLRFYQTGGNFSLQDGGPFYTGSSTLFIESDLIETAGSFVTNCTSSNPAARFAVEMRGPYHIASPDGEHFLGQTISMSSGSINNNTNMVTLRMAQVPFQYHPFPWETAVSPLGVYLKSQLHVGKLELNGGPIFVGAPDFLEVDNPSPSAVQITGTNSYVDGPVRRIANYAGPVMFPTGKGTALNFHLDTCVIIPSSTVASMYQAESFRSAYPDQTVTAPFKGVSNSQYWNISKLYGADARLMLVLTAPVPGATAADKVIPAHYVNGKWISEQGTVIYPGNSGTGSVRTNQLNSYGVFTFGYGSFPIFQVAQSQLSAENPTAAASNIMAEEYTVQAMALVPTLVQGSATLKVHANKGGRMQLMVTDMAGRTWKKLVLPVTEGSSTNLINLSGLPAGTYQISGYLEGKQTAVVRFVKL